MNEFPLTGSALVYPQTRRADTVDNYHGTLIADPYRWLEEIRSAETEAWVAQQNTLSEAWLEARRDGDGHALRATIQARLMRLAGGERRGLPFEAGGLYFRLMNDGSHDQDRLFVSEGLDGPARLLLDPNTLSDNGSVSLLRWLPSRDGTKLLYGLSSSGSDWTQWHVRDVAGGAELPDIIHFGKYANAAWNADGSGFWYLRFPEPQPGQEHLGSNRDSGIWLHRLGTAQSEDVLVFALPDEPETGIFFGANEDRSLLLVHASRRGSPAGRLYIIDNTDPAARPWLLLDSEEFHFFLLGNAEGRYWFRTDHGAPNWRIIELDRAHPDPAAWRELVAERSEAMRGAALYGGRFVCSYLRDAVSIIELHGLDGTHLTTLELPGQGNVEFMQGHADSPEFFLSYTDGVTPEHVLRVDLGACGKPQPAPIDPPTDNGFDPALYVARTVFYESSDGTSVPLHLAHRRDLQLNGNTPTILYGYGGFGIPQIPKFTAARAAWIEMGGVFAIAGIRGGSEYGRDWHHAAIKLQRQRAYDDFIAAAEFLIEQGYCSRDCLAIQGRSNGGLLVGAVMCQRPELFAVALPQVGVMDMLRFNRFTAGPHWESDYGSPQDPAEFAAIRAYSPLHNLRRGVCYPATLVTTGDTDDRVVPSHSYKFAAELQHVQACQRPVLIRIDTRAGHGQGKPIAQEMREFADMYTFALSNMQLR